MKRQMVLNPKLWKLACLLTRSWLQTTSGISFSLFVIRQYSIFVLHSPPTSSILQKQAKELYIEDASFISSLWVMERLISLLSDSSSDIKACAAFALLQYTTPCNVDRIKNMKLAQEAGG